MDKLSTVQISNHFSTNKNTTVTDSLIIARTFGKAHRNVISDIKNILIRDNTQENNFSEIEYIHDQNKQVYTKFLISKEGKYLLEMKYSHGSQSPKLEFGFKQILEEFFKEKYFEYQKPIGKYRVDFLFNNNIVVEYDEEFHELQVESDKQREEEIKELLWNEIINIKKNEHLKLKDKNEYVKILRIKKGEEIKGLKNLLLLIQEENHDLSLNTFMKDHD
ncbi:TPA: Rha family transcriptional regulator [Bacillus tropicus]|uniref:Rha family transcriptional regulator n=1 Tax=Bacillus tropicus TaxID=2026188 RepID=UPI00003CC2A6|nr:Rha family transcriptional regulator [Bacillus tropicus]AIY72824.1 phage regulatory, Rha family protein [Bacillus cereus]AJI02678.1 phage regulatory, Rha family protein [Bacillus cereus G9241]EAL12049.1 hypothetical protein protein [Bacillus cereus G9241]QPS48259.1 Rha family transcriptional regulator [Bacillus tropicus]